MQFCYRKCLSPENTLKICIITLEMVKYMSYCTHTNTHMQRYVYRGSIIARHLLSEAFGLVAGGGEEMVDLLFH